MERMRLTKAPTGWHITWMEGGEDTYRLFGTYTLPTPFTANAAPGDVMAEIRRLNPHAIVTF